MKSSRRPSSAWRRPSHAAPECSSKADTSSRTPTSCCRTPQPASPFETGDEIAKTRRLSHVDYLTNTAVLGPVHHVSITGGACRGLQSRNRRGYLSPRPPMARWGEVTRLTMTQGIVSGLAEWSPADLTLIQTDAGRAIGHHGGALVSADGTVIGISGLVDLHSHIPLVPTVGSLMPRLLALLDSGSVSDAGDRLVREDDLNVSHEGELDVTVGAGRLPD